MAGHAYKKKLEQALGIKRKSRASIAKSYRRSASQRRRNGDGTMAENPTDASLVIKTGSGYKQTGRALALRTLDDFLSSEAIQGDLRDAFYERFIQDPVAFFTQFVIPLMPKTSLVAFQGSLDITGGDVLEALRKKVLQSTTIPGEIIDVVPKAGN